jgi:hypothetical protein
MISFEQKGDFSKTEQFLNRMKKKEMFKNLSIYGQRGVDALRKATPKNTGLTADSWRYEIKINKNDVRIIWSNVNIQNGVPIAVILQYGHATGMGGYIQGIDYINPAIKPIFDDISEKVWKEMKR